jgi:hypothetical protein
MWTVPQDFKDMADEPSQIVQLPDAYRPEMMAMLDMQCRLFLQSVLPTFDFQFSAEQCASHQPQVAS